MLFGDGTTQEALTCTLDFYTKVQVWGRMVKVSPQVPYTPKVILVKKNDVNSTLIKKEKREK